MQKVRTRKATNDDTFHAVPKTYEKALLNIQSIPQYILQEFKLTNQKDMEHNKRLLETVTRAVPGNSSTRITAFTNIFKTF